MRLCHVYATMQGYANAIFARELFVAHHPGTVSRPAYIALLMRVTKLEILSCVDSYASASE